MAAAKCRNRRRELTDTLQAVSAAREAGEVSQEEGGRVARGGTPAGLMLALADSPACSAGDRPAGGGEVCAAGRDR